MSDAAVPEIPSQQAAASVAVRNEDWLAIIPDLLGFSREWWGPACLRHLDLRRVSGDCCQRCHPVRPAVPVLVSSLVVIFAVVEVLILPFVWQSGTTSNRG